MIAPNVQILSPISQVHRPLVLRGSVDCFINVLADACPRPCLLERLAAAQLGPGGVTLLTDALLPSHIYLMHTHTHTHQHSYTYFILARKPFFVSCSHVNKDLLIFFSPELCLTFPLLTLFCHTPGAPALFLLQLHPSRAVLVFFKSLYLHLSIALFPLLSFYLHVCVFSTLQFTVLKQQWVRFT